ncbi:sigma-70 family RNA polymerase sigma factor [Pseudomonas lalucatii]|nr:sigma-70 family RNA polymerase sigma factor [Pseudomonas lalucatii]
MTASWWSWPRPWPAPTWPRTWPRKPGSRLSPPSPSSRAAKLRTWLARIALNEARAMLRKAKREVAWDAWGADGGSPIEGRFNRDGTWTRPPIRWHHDSPEALLTEEELYQCIRQHLHKLPRDQQSVVMLREVAGLDFSEIAQALQLAEGNVRVLLHRGRQRLHAMLEHFEEVGTC